MSIPVALSTSSLFPKGVEETFATAAALGYDGVEVMVTHLPDSREIHRLESLSERYDQPILAVHAPTLFWTQHVWGSAWQKMERSVSLALALGAQSVVAHPPFRWQKNYARDFVSGVARLEESSGVQICVENMYPWRAGGREVEMYLPHWDPVPREYRHVTWDFSHAALAHVNSLEAFELLGDRLRHLHVTDGFSGGTADDHLLPGQGDQRVAECLQYCKDRGFSGTATIEVSTRKAKSPEQRHERLAECLDFTKRNLGLL